MSWHQGRPSIFIYLLYFVFIINVLANNNSSAQQSLFDNETIDFTLEGKFCQVKRSSGRNSNETFPDKTCYCDDVCHILEDCCWDYKSTNHASSELGKYSKSQFSCIERPEIVNNNNNGIVIIDKCASNWNDIDILTKCENIQNSTDIFLYIPVTESFSNIMFKNVFCALCNFVDDFKVWKAEMKCPNDPHAYDKVENPYCNISFESPDQTVKARYCSLNTVIDQCLAEETDEELKQNCTNGDFSIVYENFSVFRNIYCAYCNGFNNDDESITCDEIIYDQVILESNVTNFHLRVLVDALENIVLDAQHDVHDCIDDEVFDPFTKLCRKIICLFPYIAKQGRCEKAPKTTNDTSDQLLPLASNASVLKNCEKLARFNATEFEMRNGTGVFIFSLNKVFGNESFLKTDSDVFICLERNQICLHFCNPAQKMFIFTEAENILTLICLIISLLSLIITFLVYISFPQLLNTPGKILISLVISLFLAQLLFLIATEVNLLLKLCQALGIFVHYFYLAAFCWMSIIALDLWLTFSNQFVSVDSSKTSKRLRLYNLYGWLTPLVIVLIAVILDNVDFDNKYENLKPKYSNGVCWITSRDALILFFVGPLALFKLFDIVAFIFTAIHIKAKRQGAMATQKKNACSFFINLKLSLVMGLTWVFAFVANVVNIPAFWYLFIIFNALQGLFICLSFLCTRKVTRLLKEKYYLISKSGDSSTSIELTTYKRKPDTI